MIVPEYWAEASKTTKLPNGPATCRRFGWSDISLDDAQAMAEQRVDDAIDNWRKGIYSRRSEPRVPYNGAEGVPIREEVIRRDGDNVVTRNSYGALCLNTPNVLFADIDDDDRLGWLPVLQMYITLAVLIHFTASWFGLLRYFLLFMVLLLLMMPLVVKLTKWARRSMLGDARQQARNKVERFCQANPDWHLRLYETPNGWRVLAMHDVFDPTSEEVETFFETLNVDRVYAQMCRNQHCFRARLTPKPWRVEMSENMKPRPGVWPIDPSRLPDRQRWVAEYEKHCVGFAACRFEDAFGSNTTNVQAERVRKLHDDLSLAHRDLPLA